MWIWGGGTAFAPNYQILLRGEDDALLQWTSFYFFFLFLYIKNFSGHSYASF